jgi:FAD/FMN-containing dehydrogenase
MLHRLVHYSSDPSLKPAMARFHHVRPRAVALCESAADVAEALDDARSQGLHVAPRSGGHCFAGRSSTTGIVLDVSPMDSVAVSDGVATVGAGTRLAALYDALDDHGVTIPAGCGPTVGITGLTLGGGLGILGRRYGLTSDRLLAAQVVLADGRVVECDAHHDPDLFWALRGAGGGQFGVVTSLTFETVPATPATTFHLVWPATSAATAIDAWQRWAPDAPEECSASLKVADAVHVFGAVLGSEAETVPLLDELIAGVGADPVSAAHRQRPYRAAKQALVGIGDPADDDPDRPKLVFSKSEFFRRPLAVETIDELVRMLREPRARGEARELNFTPMGGAYNRVPADATAFVHREERFLLEHVLVLDQDAPHDGRGWVRRSWAAAHPRGSGRVYPNFPDPELADWVGAYHGPNHGRLARVKRAYDPAAVFRFPQAVSAR